MSISTYDIGDVAELSGAFTDTYTGAAVEPQTVVCTVRKPNGTTLTPDVADHGDGTYTAEVTLDRPGSWWYAFDGIGGEQASGERELRVRTRRVTR